MKERPILFSGAMVRAILDGRKTQTRRVVKPQPNHIYGLTDDRITCYHSELAVAPFFVGQRLWVRETFYCDDYHYPNIPEDERNDPDWKNQMLYYRADGDLCQQIPECDCSEAKGRWRPPMFMFRWASRINLELTAVRVERLQKIDTHDAFKEGISCPACDEPTEVGDEMGHIEAVPAYKKLWDSINAKKHPWASNPWVWVLTFKRI